MQLPPIALYCSSGSWGGLEMNTVRLAKWMHQQGHHVTLCCLPGSPLAKQAGSDELPEIPIRRNGRYFDIIRARRVWKELREQGVRILIIVDNRDLDFGGWVKLVSGNKIRLVYQQHMMLGIAKRDLLHTFRFRRLDAWITLLPYMAKEIREKTNYYPNRIHTIPLGLDLDSMGTQRYSKEEARETLGLPQNKTILGILGRLDRQKGQHLVIEAINQLRKENKELYLLIMGESTRHEGKAYIEELQMLVERNGLQEAVIFQGYQEDVSLFYSAIDLFILGSYGETYGMVTIESMIYGIPVIGSEAGGTPELLGHGKYGWLYKSQDAEDLAMKIKEVLIAPDQMQQKARQAQEYAKRAFSHKTECSRIEKVLAGLL